MGSGCNCLPCSYTNFWTKIDELPPRSARRRRDNVKSATANSAISFDSAPLRAGWRDAMDLRKLARLYHFITVYGIFHTFFVTVHAIDCFKCVSMNWDNPACDDPFHNNNTLDILEAPCLGGRKNRDGLFPATSCIKIAGVFDDTGEHITVRGCALDSGTLTTDTEIVRMSHCGRLYYDDRYVRGCLQSCNDAEACNESPSITQKLSKIILISITFHMLIYAII